MSVLYVDNRVGLHSGSFVKKAVHSPNYMLFTNYLMQFDIYSQRISCSVSGGIK